VDDRTAVRGAIREFIEATTPYKVCDAIDNDLSVIHKTTEARCDLILIHLGVPLQDSLVTVSVLRTKLPYVKIVGFSTLPVNLGTWCLRELDWIQSALRKTGCQSWWGP